MARYGYVSIVVAVCRDFDKDVHMRVIDPGNPVKSLLNLMDDTGKAVVEVRTILGRAHDMDNYMYPVSNNNRVMYRSCIVVDKYYLKLPYLMTKEQAIKYLQEITGIKLPVKPNTETEKEFLIKLYEELKNH